MALPDVLVIGAPKAGSTAIHAALATHPDVFASTPKEPKYFLCGDEPPPKQYGPGDAHSRKEWVWERDRYETLFADAAEGALRVESTPFYLWDTEAHPRIAAAIPDAKLIAVVRDPVDRAHSNWTHLWCDGYEPVGDLVKAVDLEPQRIGAGWAPFWRYVDQGLYGQQLQHLYQHVPSEQVLVLRYRDLVDTPKETLEQVAEFLAIDPLGFTTIPNANVTGWAPDNLRNSALRRVVRSGAYLGQFAPPQYWRSAEKPLRKALRRGGHARPELSVDDRTALQAHFVDDIELLGELTGLDLTGWLDQRGRGAYSVRSAWDPSVDEAS